MINKIDFLKIASMLDEFGELCDRQNIKFNKFTEEELLELLKMYKNYKLGDKPPF